MADYSTSIHIEAPPDVVFDHLVTVSGMLAWMGQYAELQPTLNGAFAVDINGVRIRGCYLEVDPPHRVVVSWGVQGSDDHPPGSSRVAFTLTASGAGTRLDLTHSGLPERRTPMHAAGWTHFLTRLQLAAMGIDPGADRWNPTAPDHRLERGGPRVRRSGGGRKAITIRDPTLVQDLEALVDPVTRGDPESPLV